MEPALIIGLTESITLAIIGIVGKWIVSRNEASNKKIAKRNSRIAQARDKEQLAFKKQIRGALEGLQRSKRRTRARKVAGRN